MSDTDNTIGQEDRKTSLLARWSFWLAAVTIVLIGIGYLSDLMTEPEAGSRLTTVWKIAVVFYGVWFILAFPFVCLLSVVSLIVVAANHRKVKGLWRAVVSVVICLGAGIIMFIMVRALMFRMVCGTDINQIAREMNVYLHKHNDVYPLSENWCDLLIQHCDCSPNMFLCRCSDATIGESSYAMNVKVAGKNSRDIPGDVVLLFETDYGRINGPRDGLLRDRQFYTFLEWDKSSTVKERDGSRKVYSKRWNQSGGPEIAAAKRHRCGWMKGGMNVVFCDWHLEFVTEDNIGKLRWTVEEPNE